MFLPLAAVGRTASMGRRAQTCPVCTTVLSLTRQWQDRRIIVTIGIRLCPSLAICPVLAIRPGLPTVLACPSHPSWSALSPLSWPVLSLPVPPLPGPSSPITSRIGAAPTRANPIRPLGALFPQLCRNTRPRGRLPRGSPRANRPLSHGFPQFCRKTRPRGRLPQESFGRSAPLSIWETSTQVILIVIILIMIRIFID